MLRSICAVLAVGALTLPSQTDIDAVAFAKAFKAGQADQFKNKRVAGSGMSFHGAIKERIADGSTRVSLVVTLGAAPAADGPVAPILTWDEFTSAEGSRTTLVVALSGPDLPPVPAQPARITFAGVFDGQVRTIMRLPQPGDAAPDSGPCPGEQRAGGEAGAFYCAALLTGATATIAPK